MPFIEQTYINIQKEVSESEKKECVEKKTLHEARIEEWRLKQEPITPSTQTNKDAVCSAAPATPGQSKRNRDEEGEGGNEKKKRNQ